MLASCGDSAVSRREFVARADAICASALRRTREIPPPTGTGTRALATYLDTVMPVLRSEGRQLRGLPRPATGPGRQLTAFLSSFDAALGHYAAVAAAARRGDAAAVAREEASVRAAPTAALAARYGLRVCGAAPSTAA
jgi:hypothetical protein